ADHRRAGVRGLLGNRAGHVQVVERERRRYGAHALDAGDGGDLALREAQLRGHEVVAREVAAGLTRVAQPEARRPVLLAQLVLLGRREPPRATGAAARSERLVGTRAAHLQRAA